jgi:hypothetical protein
MKKLNLILALAGLTIFTSCQDSEKKTATEASSAEMQMENQNRKS